ncbi:FecCD family ABC transporter permease [Aquabacterium sp. OR-4]|uniref:FecCD family ABC transporter permease n=1 Tax=Aquabacterium sp. OR-4 TaxID=2978127 RepID=UPI0028C96DF1|nr:iron ABC transporter permease [Aquabacterium sp. OR-4]MDT7839054.1 iron ABC transporter permease [Aquabacterium sp. OR-4]
MALALALAAVIALLAAASLLVGAKPVPWADVLQALRAFDAGNPDHLLVVHLRLPRLLTGLLVGAALGAAGLLIQAVTRNVLADPGILGVNAGASLAVVAALALFGPLALAEQMLVAMLGALLAGGVVLALSGGQGARSSPSRVVLAGVAVSAVCLSFSQLIMLNSADQVFDHYRSWVVGALEGRDLPLLLATLPFVAMGLALAVWVAGQLDALSLGQDLGMALGVNRPRVLGLSLLAIVVLAGAATAAVGPIAFLGLVAPHLARAVVGPNHRRLLRWSMLLGMLTLLLADVAGRVIAPPADLGAGLMVALIGGPFFIVLARRDRLTEL